MAAWGRVWWGEVRPDRLALYAPATGRRWHADLPVIAALHPEEPYWYLPVIGVDPSRQGRGSGRHVRPPTMG